MIYWWAYPSSFMYRWDDRMKAIVYTQYGSPDVLKLKEINKPQPEVHELLIKIHATIVTSGNCKLRSCQIPFLF